MIAKLHNIYASMTEAEKRIAEVILADPLGVTRLQAKTLAERAGTASSAVTRFCRTVGVQSYAELKLLLAEEGAKLSSPETLVKVNEADSVANVFAKVFASGVRALNDTLAMIDPAQAEAMVTVLAEAHRIVFFGVGTSSVIAVDANYRISQLGLNTTCCTDVLFMNVTAANLKPGEVAVGISHSGNTKATVDALRRARAAGAVTLAITSFSGGLLASESDHALVAFSDEQNYPVEAVSARVAHICIVDSLMMALATQQGDALSAHLLERNRILDEIRYKNEGGQRCYF